MTTPLLVGNWKMNGNWADNEILLSALAQHSLTPAVRMAVCVPFVYIEQTGRLLENTAIAYGAQNVSPYEVGAYTGEVSAAMLKDMGCQYAIIGHSERRQLFQETDDAIAHKVLQTLEAGITPILCVGETLSERESGETLTRIHQQLRDVLSALPSGFNEDFVVAYEPLWAIGTGHCANSEQIQEVHGAIRHQVEDSGRVNPNRLQILYGGSVKPDNAESIFEVPHVDGALVGGACLVASDFLRIYDLLRKRNRNC